MINITTNATPVINVSVYSKGVDDYELHGQINVTFQEMERFYMAMNSTKRDMWENQEDIKTLMNYISKAFLISETDIVDVDVQFPISFINWMRNTGTDDESTDYSQDDIGNVIEESEYVFADEEDEIENIDLDFILSHYRNQESH